MLGSLLGAAAQQPPRAETHRAGTRVSATSTAIDHDRDAGRADALHQRRLEDEQAAERDGHGEAGEDHRAAGRVDGAGDRVDGSSCAGISRDRQALRHAPAAPP